MSPAAEPHPAAGGEGAVSYPPIGDYALIGDCRCAALVSKHGAIDWLCLPRFDSPAVFGAILDRGRGGHFAIRPSGPAEISRRYVDETNVLETTFRTRTGVWKLTDLMPVYHRWYSGLIPERHVLRLVEGVEGEAEVEVEYLPRLEYGRVIPGLERRGGLGIFAQCGGKALVLRSEIPLALEAGRGRAWGRHRLRAGERRALSLAFTEGQPMALPVLGPEAAVLCQTTIEWWRGWSGQFRYAGPFREQVIRSALVLKLLTYAPSGAVIAAPTSSLPERIGGDLNWDYRFCWLRDASMTVRAFYHLGYGQEAESFLSWLIHTTRLTRPRLQVVYSLYGETNLREKELDDLEGYRGSRPVRMGNKAVEQLQLDTYGEVAQAAYELVSRGGKIDRATAGMLQGMGRAVCELWRRPDAGIWESRGKAKHHTYSKVMCWVALHRLLQLHEGGHLKLDAARLAGEREAIRNEIETMGFSHRRDCYRGTFGGYDIDVSLLALPIYGYLPADHPRMRRTYEVIWEQLGDNGLLRRFRQIDGRFMQEEGAFGAACFWSVECLAMAGRAAEARAQLEYLLRYANDLWLYGEEIEVETGAALGNFPQAYTHIGLINAAAALARAEAGRG
ncbi:MAG: glycoside hydrolase family 15 protein [Desulfobacteraceae bacterium]|nr:glycoside hydrolase family 15 protein [Desulfobacteraceae bacterium]